MLDIGIKINNVNKVRVLSILLYRRPIVTLRQKCFDSHII